MLQRTRMPAGKIKPQFLARELAVLAFNQRVLAQAQDRRVPALERLRVPCILSSNPDEFFDLPLADLKERLPPRHQTPCPSEAPSARGFPPATERTPNPCAP